MNKLKRYLICFVIFMIILLFLLGLVFIGIGLIINYSLPHPILKVYLFWCLGAGSILMSFFYAYVTRDYLFHDKHKEQPYV